ncbi:hypothetical protein VTN31DRAFT_4752 [Thermomyces dupontii]|uniref:uncharacterized protein n=1 Tax=Talaromyces thermophilus TaxID=28565 RepID=UPI0037433168
MPVRHGSGTFVPRHGSNLGVYVPVGLDINGKTMHNRDQNSDQHPRRREHRSAIKDEPVKGLGFDAALEESPTAERSKPKRPQRPEAKAKALKA